MAIESQNTKLEMGTGTGGAVTGCSAVLGYPTIISKTAHGLAKGDVVTLAGATGVDAALLNSQIVIVQFVLANSFAVNIDTTGKAAMGSSISATPVAWSAIGEITDMNKEDPGAAEIPTTHLKSTAKEYLVGLTDSGTYTFNINWLFGDAGQQALITSKNARTKKNYKVTYSDNSTITFSAYVQTIGGPSLAVDDKVSGSVTLRISGDVTITPA